MPIDLGIVIKSKDDAREKVEQSNLTNDTTIAFQTDGDTHKLMLIEEHEIEKVEIKEGEIIKEEK